jgi:hypothetical protein
MKTIPSLVANGWRNPVRDAFTPYARARHAAKQMPLAVQWGLQHLDQRAAERAVAREDEQ